jgi:hypothetical protein
MEREYLEQHVADAIVEGQKLLLNDIVEGIIALKKGWEEVEELIEKREQGRRGIFWSA